MEPEKRLGFVGIVVERREETARINRVLSDCARVIRGRIGVPKPEDETAVIGLIVEGTNEEVGALTGKLGNIPGITVKSALTGKKTKRPDAEKETRGMKSETDDRKDEEK